MSSRIVFSYAAVFAAAAIGLVAARQPTPSQPVLGTRTVKVLDVDGLKFKDLNKNGKLDVYEDWRKPVDAPGLQDFAERLSESFDTRVTVSLGKRKGKIVVEFGNVDDLQRIVSLMEQQSAIA